MLADLNEKLEVGEQIEKEYGDKENYSFLIKWEGLEYLQVSWEDEYVVSKFPDKLRKFLEIKINEEKWRITPD
jgi:hypothetical protein